VVPTSIHGLEVLPVLAGTKAGAEAWDLHGKTILVSPNPSSGMSMVFFVLPQAGKARLLLSEITGEAPYKMDLGEVGPGEHSQRLDFSDFASGIYFVQLQADFGFGYKVLGTFKTALLR
jgi:hypothetical protein